MSNVAAVRVESLESRTLLSVDLVADLNPVTASTAPASITPVGQTAYFARNSELWKTDGTVQGSSKVGTFGDPNLSISGLTSLPGPASSFSNTTGRCIELTGRPPARWC